MTENHLGHKIRRIAAGGIRADRRRLKEDMCAQFKDPREWVREFVVNSSDAGARFCWISGLEDKKTLTIIIEDNGRGMNRKEVIDFFHVYRSGKHKDSPGTVGRHGIGKLSVAAIPGQCGFSMITSTGTECWRAKAGNLLDEKPIELEQVEPIPPWGTRFEITFKKQLSLVEELKKLGDILERYLRLPLTIIICENDGDDVRALDKARWIQRDWYVRTGIGFDRRYEFEIKGRTFDAVFSLDSTVHEIYQNRVLVTERYNLLSHDLRQDLRIPHLKIRVDCPDFELPFGRHCLKNEELLDPLSRHLRTNILPQYFDELFECYHSGLLADYGVSFMVVEDMACGLIAYDSGGQRNWCRLPVFASLNHKRFSLAELRKMVKDTGVLYIEDNNTRGVDYSVFNAPVINSRMPGNRLLLIEKLFQKELVNLGKHHKTVIEAPVENCPQLTPREQQFQKVLGFHPEVLKMSKPKNKHDREKSAFLDFISVVGKLGRVSGINKESQNAQDDLKNLKWRVNYLVEKDGKTPCISHKFLFRNDTVILNLNHTEIRNLIDLSETAPALASHWSLAMCLAEESKILPHYSPDAREDLVMVDAMAKCVSPVQISINDGKANDKKDKGFSFRDFLRDIEDKNIWMQ